MDHAKAVAQTVAPIAVDKEVSIIDRPLTVPRWEGPTELLVAREMTVNTYFGGKGEGGQRGGGKGQTVHMRGVVFSAQVL